MTGGICGYNQGGDILNCYNYGEVRGPNQVGGIAGNSDGRLASDGVSLVVNCKNFGNIYGISREEPDMEVKCLMEVSVGVHLK